MPQIQLPLFPEGMTAITDEIGFKKEEGRVVYFNGHLPVFMHDADDLQTFRMITSQFIVTGLAKQRVIADTFGVPLVTVKRAVKLYRKTGPKGFYAKRKCRGAVVLTTEALQKAQKLLDDGTELSEISTELHIKTNTLNKAIHAGKLHRVEKKTHNELSR